MNSEYLYFGIMIGVVAAMLIYYFFNLAGWRFVRLRFSDEEQYKKEFDYDHPKTQEHWRLMKALGKALEVNYNPDEDPAQGQFGFLSTWRRRDQKHHHVGIRVTIWRDKI